MDTYLQGRRVPDSRRQVQPAGDAIQLIRKLRWIGMEEEAQQAQGQLRKTASVGRVLTSPRETD
jgi:hypothetical protein